MLRRLMASVLFGLGFMVVASAQPDPDAAKKAPENKAAEKKAANPLDDLIGAALVNDADVKVAHAKLQMAEAELTRARQLVTQKVISVDAAIGEQKKAVATAQLLFTQASEMHKRGATSFAEVLAVREKLETAQGKLALLETEMKILTRASGIRTGAGDLWDDLNKVHQKAVWGDSCMACHDKPLGFRGAGKGDLSNTEFLLNALSSAHGRTWTYKTPAGPLSDRIRAALDKPVKLGAKDAKITFEQAVDVFKKEAGLDVPVRMEFKVGPIVSLGEELPVGAWLQLFADGTRDIRVLIREYGLLVTSKDAAPPDAMSVFDFWKQKPEKKP